MVLKNHSTKEIKIIKNNTTLQTLWIPLTKKKITYNPWVNNKFQKILKDFNITLALINKCNNKKLINTNY